MMLNMFFFPDTYEVEMTEDQEPFEKSKSKGKAGGRGKTKNKPSTRTSGSDEAAASDCDQQKAAASDSDSNFQPIKKHTALKNKFKAFQFVERNVSDVSESDKESCLNEVKLKKKKKRHSDLERSVISVIQEIDDGDFEEDHPTVVSTVTDNSMDMVTESHTVHSGDDAERSRVVSELPDLQAEGFPLDKLSSGFDIGEPMDTSHGGDESITVGDAEEEIKLSELLPIFTPISKVDHTSPGLLRRIRTPPSLDEISCAFAELDKKGRISPVDILDMVDNWTQSHSIAADLEGSRTNLCNHERLKSDSSKSEISSSNIEDLERSSANDLERSVPIRCDLDMSDDDAGTKLVKSDLKIFSDANAAPVVKSDIHHKTGPKLSVSSTSIRINGADMIKPKVPVDIAGFECVSNPSERAEDASDEFDDDSLFDDPSMLHYGESSIKRRAKPLFKKHSSAESHHVTVKDPHTIGSEHNKESIEKASAHLSNSGGVDSTVNVHCGEINDSPFEMSGFDAADFGEPFTMEEMSPKASVEMEIHNSNKMLDISLDILTSKHLSFRAPKLQPNSTSTPVLPPRSTSVLPPHSTPVLPPRSTSVLPPRSTLVLPPRVILETPIRKPSELPSSLKEGHNSFFEEIDDSLFAGVLICEGVVRTGSRRAESSTTAADRHDKSQVTFTQAMELINSSHNISHMSSNSSADKSSGSHSHLSSNSSTDNRSNKNTESLKSVSDPDNTTETRSPSDSSNAQNHSNSVQVDKSPRILPQPDTTKTVERNTKVCDEPQFDLGFDFDLDEFEDEIIPPSPEHVIRPPASQRLAISVLKSSDRTLSCDLKPFESYSSVNIGNIAKFSANVSDSEHRDSVPADMSNQLASKQSVNASRLPVSRADTERCNPPIPEDMSRSKPFKSTVSRASTDAAAKPLPNASLTVSKLCRNRPKSTVHGERCKPMVDVKCCKPTVHVECSKPLVHAECSKPTVQAECPTPTVHAVEQSPTLVNHHVLFQTDCHRLC